MSMVQEHLFYFKAPFLVLSLSKVFTPFILSFDMCSSDFMSLQLLLNKAAALLPTLLHPNSDVGHLRKADKCNVGHA